MIHSNSDLDAAVNPVEGFRQILERNRVWEKGTVQVVAGDLPERFQIEGCLAQALLTLREQPLTDAFAGVVVILLSTQSAPKLPVGVEIRVAEGATLNVLQSAIRAVPTGVAILLVNIEDVWAGVADRDGPNFQSWLFPEGKSNSPFGRVQASLKLTLFALHTLAEEIGVSIIATSKLASGLWSHLESELAELKNLLWCSFEKPSGGIDNEWLIERQKELKAGKLTLLKLWEALEQNIQDPPTLESTWAQVLASVGSHYDAWERMKPHASWFGASDVSQMIRLAQMAADALDTDSALKWIENARKSGIKIFQDWCIVVSLAKSFGSQSLEVSLMEQMAQHFPNEEGVADWQMRRCIVTGDLGAAATFARRLGKEVRASLLEEISTGQLGLLEIRKLDLPAEEKAFTLQSLANYLVSLGKQLSAFRAASEVPKGTEQEIPSLRVRWSALAALTVKEGNASDQHVEMLKQLITDTLPHSQNTDLRRLIDSVCEDAITQKSHLLLFTALANNLLISVLKRSEGKPWRGRAFNEADELPVSGIIPFMKAFLSKQPSRILILGKARLPESLFEHATPGMVTAMMRLLNIAEPEPSKPEALLQLLVALECLARHLNDPTTDILAGLYIVKRTAMAGDGQSARNLAEEFVRALPSTQPTYQRWRLGVAWLAMAESRVSAGSSNEGMRYLCFALCSFLDDLQHAEIIAESFNIAARAMRELGMYSLSEQAFRVEAELGALYEDGYRQQKATNTKDMLSLRLLSQSSAAEIIRYLHRQMAQLRQMSESEDMGPILSCICNACRFARLRGLLVSANLIAEINDRLELFKLGRPGPAWILEGLLRWPPDSAWFMEQAQKQSMSLRAEDMGGQLHKLAICARDAFVYACEVHDSKLALITGVILCQPALMKRQAARAIPEDRASLGLRQFWVSQDPAMVDERQIKDTGRLLNERSQPRLHSLASAIHYDLKVMRDCLQEEEAILILVHSNSKELPLAGLYIDKQKARAEHRFLTIPSHWTQASVDRWERALFSDQAPVSLSDETPDDVLLPLAAEFALHVDPLPAKLCIIPDSELFGFPFAISPLIRFSIPDYPHGNVALESTSCHLVDIAEICVSPSLEHFVRRRQERHQPTGRRVVWSGKMTDSKDKALDTVAKYLPELLQALNCEWLVGGTPPRFDGADVGVMILHGHPNSWGEMIALKDGGQSIVPEELGSIVGGCGCFILGACHGSAESTMPTSQECRGAVSSTLASGATCVIAPSFTVTVGFLLEWIGQFLRQLDKGDSAASAAATVNRTHTSLAKRVTMQVFGDGSFKLKS